MEARPDPELFGPRPGLIATDLYQLAMLHAYVEAGMREEAVFEFFFRRLPPQRGFLIAAGLGPLLDWLESARFAPRELDWLRGTGRFPGDFIDWLAGWRFEGDVEAVPEGTVVFPNEPLVQVRAPIWAAQLVETVVINFLHFQTAIASKAARMVLAAPGAQFVDFGLRRAHSLEAGGYAARAAYLAGFAGTATVHAGAAFGIPLYGTMAHAFIQAHEDERSAFLDFAKARPRDTVFLIDTYDTEAGARTVVSLREELARAGARIGAVRIDSGDLAAHARAVRGILDEGGLTETRIIASGGLDEWSVRELASGDAPIDTFGVGTSLTTSQDAPALDCAYKLVEYAGIPRRKRSEGKTLWPGVKQVFRRRDEGGHPLCDVLGLAGEALEGEPLLQTAMCGGRRIRPGDLIEDRRRARRELALLSEGLRDLDAPATYVVEPSARLVAMAADLEARGR